MGEPHYCCNWIDVTCTQFRTPLHAKYKYMKTKTILVITYILQKLCTSVCACVWHVAKRLSTKGRSQHYCHIRTKCEGLMCSLLSWRNVMTQLLPNEYCKLAKLHNHAWRGMPYCPCLCNAWSKGRHSCTAHKQTDSIPILYVPSTFINLHVSGLGFTSDMLVHCWYSWLSGCGLSHASLLHQVKSLTNRLFHNIGWHQIPALCVRISYEILYTCS